MITFLVDKGIEDPNIAINGPCWRADDGPTLNAGWLSSFVIVQGIPTSIAKKPYFCDFLGEGEGVWTLLSMDRTHSECTCNIPLSFILFIYLLSFRQILLVDRIKLLNIQFYAYTFS